jgi:hypothetical protein
MERSSGGIENVRRYVARREVKYEETSQRFFASCGNKALVF